MKPRLAAIIRQSLQEGIECRWVPSEQQLADALTKSLHRKGLACLNDALYSNKWTLGPDPRLPETSRSRKLEIPEKKFKEGKIRDHEEATMINKMPIEIEEEDSPNTTASATSTSMDRCMCEVIPSGESRAGRKDDLVLAQVPEHCSDSSFMVQHNA